MKTNKVFLLFSLLAVLSSCSGMQYPTLAPEDVEQNYTNIFSFTYNEKECDIYVSENTKLYYSYIYNSDLIENFTFSYEYHPVAYIDTKIDELLVNELYLQASNNIDLLNTFFNDELNIYSHKEKYYFEEMITNEKSKPLGIALIEKYIQFTISYNRTYYHLSIPMDVTFLKQYKDQIQDFDNSTYLNISDFIQTYNVTKKGE